MGSWGFIGLLLFVLLNGCLPASDPQTTSKVCHFTYPSDGQKFIQMLENFYSFGEGQAFDKSSNKFLVIKQYMTLWNTYYDADISGSKLTIFAPNTLSDQDFLNAKLKPFSHQSEIEFLLTKTAYQYAENEAFVDFANAFLGGGALTHGFVQEEIEMLESNILPWLTQVSRKDPNQNSLEWCPSVSLTKLDQTPVVMKFRLPFLWDSKVYGRELDNKNNKDAFKNLIKRSTSIDIYSIAMAAIRLKNRGEYGFDNVQRMVIVSARAFYDTMLAMHEAKTPIIIHSGNWGAGVFNGTVEAAWKIQAIGMMAAFSLLKEKTGEDVRVKYIYNAFDEPSYQKAQQAKQELEGFTKVNTAKDYLEKLNQAFLGNGHW